MAAVAQKQDNIPAGVDRRQLQLRHLLKLREPSAQLRHLLKLRDSSVWHFLALMATPVSAEEFKSKLRFRFTLSKRLANIQELMLFIQAYMREETRLGLRQKRQQHKLRLQLKAKTKAGRRAARRAAIIAAANAALARNNPAYSRRITSMLKQIEAAYVDWLEFQSHSLQQLIGLLQQCEFSAKYDEEKIAANLIEAMQQRQAQEPAILDKIKRLKLVPKAADPEQVKHKLRLNEEIFARGRIVEQFENKADANKAAAKLLPACVEYQDKCRRQQQQLLPQLKPVMQRLREVDADTDLGCRVGTRPPRNDGLATANEKHRLPKAFATRPSLRNTMA